MANPIRGERRASPVAAITGLAVAWGGTALLISPASRFLGEPTQLSSFLFGQLCLWLLFAIVIGIVRLWERQPLASLWLRPFSVRSVAWGLLLVAINYAVLFPAGEWIRRSAGLSGYAAGMETVMAHPLWARALAVVGAGVVEETLFRGFAVTRLAMLTGRPWLAAALTLLAFLSLHVPLWGWGFAAGGLVGGAAAMAFFLWKKDLLALIVFHAVTDAVGLLVAPAFSEWWKDPALS